jgi:hypothetical protein
VHIHGRDLTGPALRRHIGRIEQLASIRALAAEDGPARGTRLLAVRSGGIEFDVYPDRCLDIGMLLHNGMPLAWHSPNGPSAPWRAEPTGKEWLRGWAGGLLTTCGLDTFAAPSTDDGRDFGLHGRASALQAEEVGHTGRWLAEDRYELRITGTMRQTRVFGEHLCLRRTISTVLGSNRIDVADTVSNEGFEPVEHMVLYHLNLGWPLVDAGSTVTIDPPSTVHPRDADAEIGLDRWARVPAPTPGFREQVFRHAVPTGPVTATVRNPTLGTALRVSLDSTQLPGLFQWSMYGEAMYVLGIEPANTPVITGRADARRQGELPVLAPGETRDYRLSFDVLA